jgi:hypothetical protein
MTSASGGGQHYIDVYRNLVRVKPAVDVGGQKQPILSRVHIIWTNLLRRGLVGDEIAHIVAEPNVMPAGWKYMGGNQPSTGVAIATHEAGNRAHVIVSVFEGTTEIWLICPRCAASCRTNLVNRLVIDYLK